MTPHDAVFVAGWGKSLGPEALAVLYALHAAGGTWAGHDRDLAAAAGVSLRKLQKVRGALADADALAYSPRGGSQKTYTLLVGKPPAEEAPPVVKAVKARKPQPTDALFDAIVEIAYGGIPPKKGGRIAGIAHEMLAAGLTPERLLAELPLVVQEYADWRTSLDVGTIDACWRWILSPPPKVSGAKAKPSAFDLARKATANGNPFKTTQPEVT